MDITLHHPNFARAVIAPTSKSAAHRVLIAAAFATIFGNKLGALIIAVGIGLFALSMKLRSAHLYRSESYERIIGAYKCLQL